MRSVPAQLGGVGRLRGFNKINKLTGRPPPAPEARGGQSLTKDQFVIAYKVVLYFSLRLSGFLTLFRQIN
jgi:hypothetical protein